MVIKAGFFAAAWLFMALLPPLACFTSLRRYPPFPSAVFWQKRQKPALSPKRQRRAVAAEFGGQYGSSKGSVFFKRKQNVVSLCVYFGGRRPILDIFASHFFAIYSTCGYFRLAGVERPENCNGFAVA
jgi:hypothetical protein